MAANPTDQRQAAAEQPVKLYLFVRTEPSYTSARAVFALAAYLEALGHVGIFRNPKTAFDVRKSPSLLKNRVLRAIAKKDGGLAAAIEIAEQTKGDEKTCMSVALAEVSNAEALSVVLPQMKVYFEGFACWGKGEASRLLKIQRYHIRER
jgi:hypothetical protein